MPGSVRSPHPKPDFITDFTIKEPETKLPIRSTHSNVTTKKTEEGTRGAGEKTTKKIKKVKTPEEEKIGKKVSATVSDKIPKKIATRARGTTSLNKPTHKESLDALEKTKAASGDKVPRPKEENVDRPPSRSDSRKISDDASERKLRTPPRKPRAKTMKKPLRVTNQVVAPVTTEAKVISPPIIETPTAEGPENESTATEDTIKVVNEEPQATTTTSSSHGLTCSFFEKLQLGVKAYFNSRNSFICSDKNKKGGKRTRARVRKGVKEEARKTVPGFDFKNNISISESDLLLDLFRLNPSLGGLKSNFLAKKPKITKSKKLKHNVRIPRKGYFYRSSVQYEIPEQPSSSPLELLEPCVRPKNKSKIQISGLAPTGSEIPRVPAQKRLKKRRIPPEEVSSDADSRSGSPPRKSLTDYDFSDDGLLSAEKLPSGNVITNIFPEFGEREGERRMSECEGSKKRKKSSTGVGGDSVEVLEPSGRKPSTLEMLTSCISSVLGEDELIRNLEITAVNPEEEAELAEEGQKPLITPVNADYVSSNSFVGGVNPTALLMGEIDLHLELQNYLKAFNSFNVSKTRTKNTLHSNPIKPVEVRMEEPFEGDETNLNIQSTSSPRDDTSNHPFIEELEEERVESRLFPSQTKLSNILKQMQKTKSTERIVLTDNWMDTYEKVLPLGSEGFSNSIYSAGESVIGPLWSEPTPKTFKKFQPRFWPFNVMDMIEIYKNILKEYERLQRRGKRNFGGSLTSYLISYLHDKFAERRSRENLMNLSKEVSVRQGWKSYPKKIKPVYVQEFVDLYQKMLKTSMPVKLITHLNNIIATWDSHSDYYVKNLKKRLEKTKEATTEQRKAKTAQQEVDRSPSFEGLFTPSLTELKQRPSSSKNLQLMLESFFNAERDDLSGLSNLKGKVLVDVKLAGDQIRVNDLSFVKNRIPPRKKTDTEEASELIIEAVGKSDITNVLRNETPVRKKKVVVRKRTKPKEKVENEVETPEEERITTPEFEYDEIQLRTQHPIGTISEYSEQKILDGRGPSSSDTKITEKSPDHIEILRKTLEDEILLKDFLNKFNPNEAVEGLFGTKSYLKNFPPMLKTKQPRTVRSVMDLKTNSAIWRKIHKTPSAWSRTFFCCSQLESSQEKNPNGNKKDKKLGNMSKMQKKMQEFALQRLKPRGTVFTPDSSFLDSFSVVNTDVLPEPCSVELLFSEKNPQKKSPGSGSGLCSGSKRHSGSLVNLISDEEPGFSMSNQRCPIVLHSYNQSADDGSFSLDLVHSDSFLKRFSHTSILERDTKILFKNSSDIKFSPNRVIDGKKETKPFVTFVLTPEQLEKANFSAEDAVIVQRKREPYVKLVKSPNGADEPKNEANLKSIENFIETMSVLNARAKRKKKKREVKPVEKKFNPPIFSQRKPNTRCQTCQLLSMKQNPKRKKPPKVKTYDSRSTIRSDKSPPKKIKSEISKVVTKEDASEKPVKNSESKHNNTANKKPEGKKMEKTERREVEAKNVEDLSKISLDLEDIPLELLEALKVKINQVEDLKKKNSVTKGAHDLGNKLLDNEKSGIDKTPKSFVLKIYCEKRGGSTKVEDIKREEVRPKKESKAVEAKERKELKTVDEIKEQELEEEDTTFFDAVERSLKDEMRNAVEEINKSLKSRSSKSPSSERKSFPMTPDHSNHRPPRDTSTEKSEDIFNQISDSLIEGQITYSLLLLDCFLKKKEKFLTQKEQTPKPLEQDTKTHMTKLERNAWLKILAILNSLSQLMEKNGEENLKSHLKSTQTVVQKILKLNISRLDDLQMFNSSMTQLAGSTIVDDRDEFGVIRECLKYLRQEEIPKPEIEEKMEVKKESEKCEEKTMKPNSSNEKVLTEIRLMNNKLVEDLKALEKLFMVSDSNENSISSSPYEEEKLLQEDEKTTVEEEETVDKAAGCSQLIQCLLKVWDTRMSLNTYPTDCFR